MSPNRSVHTGQPHKSEIYDFNESEISENELEVDDWVSVSASSSISTASTLPKHPVLHSRLTKPNTSTIVGQPVPGSYPATPKPQDYIPSHTPPITMVKTHLPNLAAIYIVPARSIYQRLHYDYRIPAGTPLSTLTANNGDNRPVYLHSPTEKEQYLRVCADCAKPGITLYCDGTWEKKSVGVCSEHAGVLTEHSRKYPALRVSEEKLYRAQDLSRRNDQVRDRELFAAVLEVVQPFQRVETERMGIRVFDSVAGGGDWEKVYVHRTGCNCDEAGEGLA